MNEELTLIEEWVYDSLPFGKEFNSCDVNILLGDKWIYNSYTFDTVSVLNSLREKGKVARGYGDPVFWYIKIR